MGDSIGVFITLIRLCFYSKSRGTTNMPNSQDQSIQYGWVTWTDDDPKKVTSISYEPISHDPKAVRIHLDDPRVWDFLNPPPEIFKVIKWRVSDLNQLNIIANLFDTRFPKPVYRGQANYEWALETKLERNVPEFIKNEVGLEVYEYQILTEAKRRLHHHLSTLPDDEDLLSWLALLRHNEVPTRALDVTKSMFIACHFALKDAPHDQDAALWVFPRHHIEEAYFSFSNRLREEDIRSSPFTIARYIDNQPYDWPFPKSVSKQIKAITYDSLRLHPDSPHLNFIAILEAAMLGFIEKPGIGLIEPYWLPKRMISQ